MDSQRVLEIFKEITTIPRESGHEEKIIAYLQDFAKKHSLEHKTDSVGNVLIVKPASPGKENVPTLVLQSHTDMVCEKNAGVDHDFAKDPIKYIIKDGWMIAPDTTLGADCGIGMAAELALLESDDSTGCIECLFTVSEETGLDGAFALSPSFITGKTLINLDSEDEGELFVGCAGGLDTTAEFTYDTEEVPEGRHFVKICVSNASGGHSGDDIDKGKANAVQILARFLYHAICITPERYGELNLCAIDGGNKRNAIAREAWAIIAVEDVDTLIYDYTCFASDVKSEFAAVEPDLEIYAFKTDAVSSMIANKDGWRVITALCAAPHGVLSMSQDLKGLVETSTNLASVKMLENNKIRVGTSQRSAINSARKMAGDKVEACFKLAGAKVRHESEYPGWRPNMNSKILELCKQSYEDLFGYKPVVRAIHAGLECGLFLIKYPDLDMISFGPTLRGVHAPGERLDLNSLDKFVLLLNDVISRIG